MDAQLSNALAMLRRKDAQGIKQLLEDQLEIYQAKRNPSSAQPSTSKSNKSETTQNSKIGSTQSSSASNLKRAPPVINTNISRQDSIKSKLPKIDLTTSKMPKIAKIQVPKASPSVDEITNKDKRAFGLFSNKNVSVESMDTDEDSNSGTSGAGAVIHKQASHPKIGDLSSFGNMWTQSFKNNNKESEAEDKVKKKEEEAKKKVEEAKK